MNKAFIKKRIFSVLMIPMLLLGIIGCADFKKSDKVQITMYLWDRPMMKELTPWLENRFPNIDFNFVIGYNTMEYYTYLNERESLPDIITCRRFSLNDAIPLSDKLMDLSETDVAGNNNVIATTTDIIKNLLILVFIFVLLVMISFLNYGN